MSSCKILGVLALSSLVLSSTTACKPQSGASKTNGLAASRGGNFALIVTGTSDDVDPGREANIQRMEQLLNDPALGFEHSSYRAVTKDELLAAVQSTSQQVTGDGTLFLYFNSHGAKDGTMRTASGRDLQYEDIVNAVTAGRSGPLRRLVAFIDTCYSGMSVAAAGGSTGAGGGNAAALALDDVQSGSSSAMLPEFVVSEASKANDPIAYNLISSLAAATGTGLTLADEADSGAGAGAGSGLIKEALVVQRG